LFVVSTGVVQESPTAYDQNPECQKSRNAQPRSKHIQEQWQNVVSSKPARKASTRQPPCVTWTVSRNPVGPCGTEQGTGGCVSNGVILENAASVHPSLRTVTLP